MKYSLTRTPNWMLTYELDVLQLKYGRCLLFIYSCPSVSPFFISQWTASIVSARISGMSSITRPTLRSSTSKHQKNDKQLWFREMRVKCGPSIQRSHFLRITISQGHYTGQRINTRKKSQVIGPATQDEMRGSILSCTMRHTPGPESAFINPALMCLT